MAKIEITNHDAYLMCLIQELLILNVSISVLVHLGYNLPEIVF